MTQNTAQTWPGYPPVTYQLGTNTNVKTAWLEEQPRGNEQLMEYIRQLQQEVQTTRDAYNHLNQCYQELQAEFREYKAALDRCEIPL